MIPLLVFLLACVAIYLGTILAAFSALMRFSLRMMAESTSGSRDLLGAYLEDPPALFFPAVRICRSPIAAPNAFWDMGLSWPSSSIQRL